MVSPNKQIKDLESKNNKLREDFSSLIDSYAKLELTDLRRNLQAENHKRLIDFIQRIARRLDDDDLLDVLVEEFLIELDADRVSYILPDSGSERRLAVSNEAVRANVKRLPLPYFISRETDKKYTSLIYESLDTNEIEYRKWKNPIALIPDSAFNASMEQSFQMAMEEEFNLFSRVDLVSAMAFPIKTSKGGESIICLQRTITTKAWSDLQKELFRDMCRYAGLLLEQMQLTQQVRDLKDQLSSLVNSMPSAIVGMDLLGTITMWSGRAAEFLGISEEDALGQVFWDIVPQYGFISDAIMDVMDIDDSGGLDFDIHPFRKHNGDVVYHRASIFSMFGSNRGEIAIRIDDVTKQMELNQQLFHAQKMETVGTLAGGLAHDFNNVLGGIVGTLSLLKQRSLAALSQGSDAVRIRQDIEDIEIIETCALRASDMVKRLLALSRKTVVDMEPLELNTIIENVVTLCRASFGTRIKIDPVIPRKKLWLKGNRTQLEQVILNLCVNARDAMKMGGKLGISLSEYKVTEKFRQKHSGCAEERLIRLKITDSGEGIAFNDLDKIFDPFFTTKSLKQGTGLGLSIVDKIVKEHGGYIEVESKPGICTTFTLYFSKEQPVKDVKIYSEMKLVKGTGDILVVDDDEIIRKTISRILFGAGYTVATAAGGATAVHMCESGIHFDLIILDVDMPVMNGLDTCRIIRSKLPDMKVLFCTGRQHQYQMQDKLAERFTWLITKPFSAEELSMKVRDILEAGE